MARPRQEAIETFMSITGAPESVAVQKLDEHSGDLNAAVYAHFNGGDRTSSLDLSAPAPQDDFMNIEEPIDIPHTHPVNPLLSATRVLNPFSLLDTHFRRSFFDGIYESDFPTHAPHVSHPRDVRQIPIEVKDDRTATGSSGRRPIIEDVSGSVTEIGQETRGTVIIDDDDLPSAPTGHSSQVVDVKDDSDYDVPFTRHAAPRIAPLIDDIDYNNNDIEEEMIHAAIEASKQDAEEQKTQAIICDPSSVHQFSGQSSASDDVELARAVSLSLKTAEQERALREKGKQIGEKSSSNLSDMELEEVDSMTAADGRQGIPAEKTFGLGREGNIQGEDEDEDEDTPDKLFLRRHSGNLDSSLIEQSTAVNGSPPASPPHSFGPHPQHNGRVFPSDEWGGLSSEEHDEAVMLEAAMFGGLPEGRYPYPSHPVMHGGIDRNATMYSDVPRPLSPNLAAQRLLREQQDDEYLTSLQADREKELKVMQEAELRRMEETAAREAALEKERQLEEENRRRLLEEEELERRLSAKEASLPQEPSSDDENSVTLLVRMPDGSRRGRRFLKSDKLQLLFDYIDIGRVVKPGTYRLVRPYPRRAFTDGESELTLNELGLSSKQEALFIELI